MPVDAVRSDAGSSQAVITDRAAVIETVPRTKLSKSSKSSVKRKSDAGAAAASVSAVSDVKRQRTDVVTTPTPDVSNLQYVITHYYNYF